MATDNSSFPKLVRAVFIFMVQSKKGLEERTQLLKADGGATDCSHDFPESNCENVYVRTALKFWGD